MIKIATATVTARELARLHTFSNDRRAAMKRSLSGDGRGGEVERRRGARITSG